jgi:hypothetical protein
MRRQLARNAKKSFEAVMNARCPWFSRLAHAPYKGTLLYR